MRVAKKKQAKKWLVDEKGRKYLQEYVENQEGGECIINCVDERREGCGRVYLDEGAIGLTTLSVSWRSCEGMARTLLEMVEELTEEEFLATYKTGYSQGGSTFENIIALGQRLQDIQTKTEKQLQEEHIAYCKEHGYYQEG